MDINLFAGGGGLAAGLCAVGFRPLEMYEKDGDSCDTLRRNIESQHPTLSGWVAEGDLTSVEWLDCPGPVRLLAGGIPCQPFSRAGNHRGQADARNLFPEFITAVRCLKPAAVLVENVGGLSDMPKGTPMLAGMKHMNRAGA
jgi:DNA (cytosine-5)-methyltransferase 1